MSPRKKAQAAFVTALMLLLMGGAAAFLSILHLRASEHLVSHTREVQAAIGEYESALARVGRARMDYVTNGAAAAKAAFTDSILEIPPRLQKLRQLTADNVEQQALCARLETNTAARIALSQRAVAVQRSAPDYDDQQADITKLNIPLLTEANYITQQMRAVEENLLGEREHDVRRITLFTYVILLITLILAVAMFIVHYRLLSKELSARERAEQSSRALSTRLMRLQDEERRKFSRELHDSLGQYLASLKMNLQLATSQEPEASRFAESMGILDQTIAETRTISYLLHPPLLDYAGLSSAVKWYIEGFGQRSGISVSAEIPQALGRLPEGVELVLFRVLQESLTNIHRHSKSTKADVKLKVLPQEVQLSVKDFGTGIPADVLDRFNSDGTSGVGLAGMRERVRDLGGDFKVESGERGTTIYVSIPLYNSVSGKSMTAAD